MSTTLTLQNSMTFIKPFLKNQPLQVTGQEPALTAGNLILQTMLGPPFRWRFNRSTFTFTTVVTTPPTTDYELSLPDFGFLENQWLTDPAGNIFELNGALSLAVDGSVSRPTMISPQYESNGYITFRVSNSPDQAYVATGDYQKKPPIMLSAASFWAPVEDEFMYIYNLGFLTIMSLLVNDTRFPIYEKWFIGRLLGAQDGLTDQERDIFMGQWVAQTRTLLRGQGSVNQGLTSRGQ